jgi:4'-phosphopantetheinyl transferase EntD
VIERLLPSVARAAETRSELASDAALFPAERRLLERAVERRRRQFATARACAREALGELGIAPTAILRGVQGEPLWPAGVVGSITHCRGYSACAVAWEAELVSIGIDAEPNEPLPAGLLERVALASERRRVRTAGAEDPAQRLGRRSGGEEVRLDRLLFSVKEAVYKAWFPLTGRRLGLEDVEVAIGHSGELRARLLVADPPLVAGRRLRAIDGRWALEEGVLAVAVVVER